MSEPQASTKAPPDETGPSKSPPKKVSLRRTANALKAAQAASQTVVQAPAIVPVILRVHQTGDHLALVAAKTFTSLQTLTGGTTAPVAAAASAAAAAEGDSAMLEEKLVEITALHDPQPWIFRVNSTAASNQQITPGTISLHSCIMDLQAVQDWAKKKLTAQLFPSYPAAQKKYGFSHVELSFQDQFVSRSDMFLASEAIRDQILFRGQEVVYEGIRFVVTDLLRDPNNQYHNSSSNSNQATSAATSSNAADPVAATSVTAAAEDSDTPPVEPPIRPRSEFLSVSNGIVTHQTQINFVAQTFAYTILLELSEELFYVMPDGRTATQWAVERFLREHVEQLHKVQATPAIRVVLFGRLHRDLCIPEKENILHAINFDRQYQDLEAMPDEVLLQLDLLLARLSKLYQRQPHQLFTSSKNTSLLPTICLLLDTYAAHYIDRRLDITGQAMTLLSAGKGIYRVSYHEAQTTSTKMLDAGIQFCHIVCMGRPPLHVVPLFEYPSKEVLLRAAQYQLGGDVEDVNDAVVMDVPDEGEGLVYETPHWATCMFYHPVYRGTAVGSQAHFSLMSKVAWEREFPYVNPNGSRHVHLGLNLPIAHEDQCPSCQQEFSVSRLQQVQSEVELPQDEEEEDVEEERENDSRDSGAERGREGPTRRRAGSVGGEGDHHQPTLVTRLWTEESSRSAVFGLDETATTHNNKLQTATAATFASPSKTVQSGATVRLGASSYNSLPRSLSLKTRALTRKASTFPWVSVSWYVNVNAGESAVPSAALHHNPQDLNNKKATYRQLPSNHLLDVDLNDGVLALSLQIRQWYAHQCWNPQLLTQPDLWEELMSCIDVEERRSSFNDSFPQLGDGGGMGSPASSTMNQNANNNKLFVASRVFSMHEARIINGRRLLLRWGTSAPLRFARPVEIVLRVSGPQRARFLSVMSLDEVHMTASRPFPVRYPVEEMIESVPMTLCTINIYSSILFHISPLRTIFECTASQMAEQQQQKQQQEQQERLVSGMDVHHLRWLNAHPQDSIDRLSVGEASAMLWRRLCSAPILPMFGKKPQWSEVSSNPSAAAASATLLDPIQCDRYTFEGSALLFKEALLQRLQNQYQLVGYTNTKRPGGHARVAGTLEGVEIDVKVGAKNGGGGGGGAAVEVLHGATSWSRKIMPLQDMEVTIGHQSHLMTLDADSRTVTVRRDTHNAKYSPTVTPPTMDVKFEMFNYLTGRFVQRSLTLSPVVGGKQGEFNWSTLDAFLNNSTDPIPSTVGARTLCFVVIPLCEGGAAGEGGSNNGASRRDGDGNNNNNPTTTATTLQPVIGGASSSSSSSAATPPTAAATPPSDLHSSSVAFQNFLRLVDSRYSSKLKPRLDFLKRPLWREVTGPLTFQDGQDGTSHPDDGEFLSVRLDYEPGSWQDSDLRHPVNPNTGAWIRRYCFEDRLMGAEVKLSPYFHERCSFIMCLSWFRCVSSVIRDWTHGFMLQAQRYGFKVVLAPCLLAQRGGSGSSSAEGEQKDGVNCTDFFSPRFTCTVRSREALRRILRALCEELQYFPDRYHVTEDTKLIHASGLSLVLCKDQGRRLEWCENFCGETGTAEQVRQFRAFVQLVQTTSALRT